MDNAIVASRRILFLGAGASRPFGKLLMGEFVDLLLKNYPNNKLLEKIVGREKDLEFLFEQLDELENKGFLYSPPEKASTRKLASDRTLLKLAQAAMSLKQDVRKEVYRHYSGAESAQDMKAIVGPLLDWASHSHQKMPVVFTTNYDPIVEQAAQSAGYKLIDGFPHDAAQGRYKWDPTAFRKITDPNNKALVLFKLHGSADWFNYNNETIKSPIPIYIDNDQRISHVMIYPARHKVALNDPFFTAYDYLGKCLLQAKICLAVGYSFRDYDALVRFKAATLANEKLIVIVLAPNAATLVGLLEAHGIRAAAINDGVRAFSQTYLEEITKLTRQYDRNILFEI